jgi:hypothetical protein
MKATVTVHQAQGGYSARTENNILIIFTLEPEGTLSLGEELEVDLPSLLQTQQVIRVKDQRVLSIKVRQDDIHDLELVANHRSSRTPSRKRMTR